MDVRTGLNATLVVRADGGAGIGLGHLFRSLALAEAWRRAAGDVLLVTATPRAARAARFPFRIAELPPGGPAKADLDATVSQARAVGADWIACDGYRFDLAYIDGLRSAGHRVLQVDDGVALTDCRADLVVNQNLGAERAAYRSLFGGRALLGTRYALIREAILLHGDASRPVADGLRVVALTGGSDVAALAPRFITAFRAVAPASARCDVILGPASATFNAAAAARGEDTRVALHSDPDDAGAIMARADVALTTAGTTCWELCYLGVPMAAVSVADNQRQIAAELGALEAAVDLGVHRDLSDASLGSALRSLLSDGSLRQRLAERARALIDGRGADRVVIEMRSA